MTQQPDSPYDGAERPTLADVISQALRTDRLSLHTAIPAKVVSFDGSPPVPTAEIQVDLARALLNQTTGAEVPTPIPPLPGVPVEFPRGGGFRIVWTLQPGGTGALWMSERALDIWKSQGGVQDPLIGRLHSMSDAFFRPGIHPSSDPEGAIPPGFRIEKEDGTAYFEISPAGAVTIEGVSLKHGALAAQAAMLGTAFLTLYNAHTHTTPAGPSGPPVVPMVPGTHTSTKNKVE